MAHSEPTGPFTDEELLDLLRDQSVTSQAIASEMADAGAQPIASEALEAARTVLSRLSADDVRALEEMPERLRNVVVEEAIRAKATGFVSALAQSANKALVKDGKRALHLLKTRGVAVEAPRPAAAPTTVTTPSAEDLPTYMSSANGVGERVIFISSPARLGVDVAQIVVSDEFGIVSASLAPLGRKEYKRFIQGLVNTRTGVVGEVPRAYARHLIAAALDLNARVRRPVPTGFNDVAFILGPNVGAQSSPGRSLSTSEVTEAAIQHGSKLFELELLRGWLPPDDVVRSVELRLNEVETSALYIDESQKEDRRRAIFAEAASQYWTASRRGIWAERLFDTAYLLNRAGRTEQAEWARATASAFESDRPIEAIPFCIAYMETVRSLATGTSNAGLSPRRPEPSLITPG
jgi:hypothetical protein